VGDSDRDRELAENLKIRFIHVCADNQCRTSTDCFPSAADAIRRGVEVAAC